MVRRKDRLGCDIVDNIVESIEALKFLPGFSEINICQQFFVIIMISLTTERHSRRANTVRCCVFS